jgi:hypothetical protein
MGTLVFNTDRAAPFQLLQGAGNDISYSPQLRRELFLGHRRPRFPTLEAAQLHLTRDLLQHFLGQVIKIWISTKRVEF